MVVIGKTFLQTKRVYILIGLVFCSLLTILTVDQLVLTEGETFIVGSSKTSTKGSLDLTKKNIVYPSTFTTASRISDLWDHYNIYFKEIETPKIPKEGEETISGLKDVSLIPAKLRHTFEDANVFKFNGGSSWLNGKIATAEYSDHPINLYENYGNDCKKNKKDFNLQITQYKEFDNDLDEMVLIFEDQLENDPAFKELRPFFKKDIFDQVRTGSADKHWFKFAGTSVWLKDLGVHMMISRVIYSPQGNKRNPISSFTFAQIFNANWEEVKDVELVIPTKNDVDEPEVKNIKFPKFLPIPFYNNPKYQKKVYYGTEDPRIFLTHTEDGKEEPVIVFNAHHRIIVKNEDVDEKKMNVEFGYYRSIFLAWPFRFQRGKTNVDGLPLEETNHIIYNKVVELRREDVPRLEVQKNWTPLLSYKDREVHGYDKYVYFVYRWSKLEILKCNLDNFVEGTSPCSYEYKRKIDSSKDEVGPLRGGSEMINIRDIVKNTGITLPDKEIWIGFPRAHIKDCGCGKDMYRPNLAVISRETDNSFKISQLSSFMSFNIDVYGWTNPKILCASRDPNALISNGVSGWEYRGDTDYLTLSLSVADASNQIVHIKNLLNTLLLETDMLKIDPIKGFDDNSVNCAMKESEHFCKAYGTEMKELGRVPPPEPDY